jgi:hypothetical protein
MSASWRRNANLARDAWRERQREEPPPEQRVVLALEAIDAQLASGVLTELRLGDLLDWLSSWHWQADGMAVKLTAEQRELCRTMAARAIELRGGRYRYGAFNWCAAGGKLWTEFVS